MSPAFSSGRDEGRSKAAPHDGASACAAPVRAESRPGADRPAGGLCQDSDSAVDRLMPPLGASRVSSTAARPAARTRSLRRCFSDSALSLRNGQARYYCGDGSTQRQWRRGSTHLPASGKAAPASLISWVTSVFTRPSPAATRLVGMRSRPAGGAKLTGSPRRGTLGTSPGASTLTSRRPAHILMSGVCSGMILCVLENM